MNEPQQADQMVSSKLGIVELIVRWVAGQSFNNVLLILILVSIGWLGWFGLTKAIPEHLRQIQTGYESLEKSHAKERSEAIRMYDKWFERMAPQQTANVKRE